MSSSINKLKLALSMLMDLAPMDVIEDLHNVDAIKEDLHKDNNLKKL